MLCKVLGESITDYLTPRLYEPLGIDVPFWEHSPEGVEAGGWGLQLKTEDIAKLILCYQNKGRYNGVQVIPEWWTKEATSYISDNSVSEKERDASAGYGCGFWRCAGMPNTYRAEGMFCQYAISFADYNACLVMTSEHSGLQETLDVIWKYMPDAFIQIDVCPSYDSTASSILVNHLTYFSSLLFGPGLGGQYPNLIFILFPINYCSQSVCCVKCCSPIACPN